MNWPGVSSIVSVSGKYTRDPGSNFLSIEVVADSLQLTAIEIIESNKTFLINSVNIFARNILIYTSFN